MKSVKAETKTLRVTAAATMVRSLTIRLSIALLASALSACSVYQFPGESPELPRPPVTEEGQPDYTEAPAPQTPVETAPREVEPEPGVSAAYSPLLAKAETAATRGDYEQALALLERAQRIDPDNADIYLEMARTHAARGDARQAAAMAERGLLYCVSTTQCDALKVFLR